MTSVREADEREGSLSDDWSFFKWLTTVAALKARCQTQTYRVSPGAPNFHFHQIHKQPETKSVTFPITCNRAADLPVGFCKRSLHLLTHRLVNVDVFGRIPANPASTSVVGQKRVRTREDTRVPLLFGPWETNQGCLRAWSVLKRFVGFFSIMFPMKSLAVEV